MFLVLFACLVTPNKLRTLILLKLSNLGSKGNRFKFERVWGDSDTRM